ncbi:unnamed protein product, partial [Rangifer tarandus platyrhynchus]
LVEDIIEEVKVVVAEEQEKVSVQEQEEAPEEQGQDWGLEGPAPNGGAVVLSALQANVDLMSALSSQLWDVPLHHLSIPGDFISANGFVGNDIGLNRKLLRADGRRVCGAGHRGGCITFTPCDVSGLNQKPPPG